MKGELPKAANIIKSGSRRLPDTFNEEWRVIDFSDDSENDLENKTINLEIAISKLKKSGCFMNKTKIKNFSVWARSLVK